MLFGRACQESTIEGKLFKFHWHIERHLSSPTPPSPSPPRGTCVHARVPTRPRSSVRASRREYTMACGGGGDASETELAALLSVRPLKFLTFPRPLHIDPRGDPRFRPLWLVKPTFPLQRADGSMANGNESFLATIFGRWTVYGRWMVDGKRQLGFNLLGRVVR